MNSVQYILDNLQMENNAYLKTVMRDRRCFLMQHVATVQNIQGPKIVKENVDRTIVLSLKEFCLTGNARIAQIGLFKVKMESHASPQNARKDKE